MSPAPRTVCSPKAKNGSSQVGSSHTRCQNAAGDSMVPATFVPCCPLQCWGWEKQLHLIRKHRGTNSHPTQRSTPLHNVRGWQVGEVTPRPAAAQRQNSRDSLLPPLTNTRGAHRGKTKLQGNAHNATPRCFWVFSRVSCTSCLPFLPSRMFKPHSKRCSCPLGRTQRAFW